MRTPLITGWGKCLPPAVLSNADLETLTNTTDEWITTRTGVKERRICHVETSDMASVAGLQAIAAAGLQPGDIDLVMVATCSPDRMVPSAAAMAQAKMGMPRAAAVDLNAACSGFIFALATADQMIRTGSMNRILVIGAEKLHVWLDFTDRSTSVLFGDGAGAVVIEATEDTGGLLAFELGTDGSAWEVIAVAGTGSEGAPGPGSRPIIQMDGQALFRRAVEAMGDSSLRVLAKAGLGKDDVDLLIPHQANLRIIEATARRLDLDPSRVFVNVAAYGNTSAATIPIALTEALESGRISPGATLVFTAFGGGLTWAAAAYRWGPRVTPLGQSGACLAATASTGLDLVRPNVEAYGKGV